jgi:hypothetical protein
MGSCYQGGTFTQSTLSILIVYGQMQPRIVKDLFISKWRIAETEQWDSDYIDEEDILNPIKAL